MRAWASGTHVTPKGLYPWGMARTPKTAPPAGNASGPGNGTDDLSTGRFRQLRQIWAVFKVTRQVDKALVWWMLLSFVATVAVVVGLSVLFRSVWWVGLIGGVVLGVMIALIVMARRAEAAVYRQAAGQPGAAGLALRNLRRGWSYEEQAVQVDPKTKDAVFRAVGRPGVVLLAEGPVKRVGHLVAQERRLISKVTGQSVPVTVIHVGEGEGQTPVRKVSMKIMRLTPQLTKEEVSEVYRRLHTLGGVRAPIPKGVDPQRIRPDRRMMRGR